jgi:hypothetical protein
MARTIRVADIGDYASQQMEKLLRVAVLETDRQVKEKSPVDTGRFRLGWAIGENAAPYQGPPPGNYRGQPTPPLAVNYQLGQEKLGNVYSVHNNLPYAERLAQGWSNQAPSGWVQGVAKDVQQAVKVSAARIGRES